MGRGPANAKAPNAAGTLGASQLRYALESHRQPEPKATVVLRREADAETVGHVRLVACHDSIGICFPLVKREAPGVQPGALGCCRSATTGTRH